MSIIKNGKNIIGMYKGDIPILKIFKHNNLVYQHSSTGGTETQYDITAKFNVTSTTSPTKVCNRTSAFTEMYVDSVKIDVASGYTFNTTGEHTVQYMLSDKTKIGDSALYVCRNLKYIDISKSVKTIGHNSFGYCSSLTEIVIPDGVTTIGNNTFIGCSSLTSVTIPNSVISIGPNAFYQCLIHIDNFINNSSATGYPWYAIIYDKIQEDGLYILGTTAVYCKKDVTNVTIPENITSIGHTAFKDCESLSSITIPENVESIGEAAFGFCSSLNEITCLRTTAPTLEGNVFNSLPSNGTLTYPCESDYSTWLEQLGWKDTCNPDTPGEEKWVTLTQDTDRSIQMQTFRIDTTYPEFEDGNRFITFSTEPNYPGENADLTDFSICINEDRIYDNYSRKYIREQTHIEGNVYEYTFSVPVYFAGGEPNAPLSQVQYKTTIEETPDTPGEEVSPYDITAKFDINNTSTPTFLCFSAYTSAFTEMYIDNMQISPTSAYTFSSTGEHTVGYMLKNKTTLAGNMLNGHFKGCSRMKEIKFKDALTTISGPTFSGCTNLQNVTFGSGLTSVGTSSGFFFYSIFTGCTSLNSITCLAPTAPTLLTKSIQGIENNGGTLYVPNGSDYSTWTAILTTWTIQYIT